MATYNTNEFRGGLKIMLDGDPYAIIENEFVKPGKGQAFNRVKVRNLKTDLVFPGSTGKRPIELGKAWSTAVKKAELVDFRFHDLRHSAASYLAMSGATSVELAAVLGHRSLQMVQRYAHIADGHTTAMVSKMNDKIFGGQTA